MPTPAARRPGVPTAVVALVALALVSLPVLASAVRALDAWRPVGDTAVLLLRARDVLGPASPSLGMPTSLGGAAGASLHHPGPSEFWLLWPAARSGSAAAAVLTVVLVNLASLGAVLAAVTRTAGRRAAAMLGVLLAAASASLSADLLVEPLNPSFGLLPFAACLAALLAVVERKGRWWFPVAVAFGSLAAHAHITLAILVAGAALAAGLAALPWSSPRDLRPLLAGTVLGAILWAPVVVDQVTGTGNLLALLEARNARFDAAGWDHAANVVAYALARPAWAVPAGVLDLIGDQPGWRVAIAGGLLLALGAVAVARRRGAAPAAARLLLGTIAVGALALSRMPGSFFSVAALHNYLWLWPVSAAATALLVALVASRLRLRDGAVLAGGALVLLGIGVHAARWPARPVAVPWTDAAAQAEPALLDALTADDEVLYFDLQPEFRRFGIGAALALAAEHDGRTVLVDTEFASSFGTHRVRRAAVARTVDATVLVTAADEDRLPPGARHLSSFTEPRSGVTTRVWIIRDLRP